MEAQRQWNDVQRTKKKTINQDFHIQQDYPTKTKVKIKTFPDKDRVDSLLENLPYKKNSKWYHSGWKEITPEDNLKT